MRSARRACVIVSAAVTLVSSAPALGGDEGIVAAGGVSPTALYLRAGTIDTLAVPGVPLAALVGAHPAGTRFVAQLDGPMTPQRRARLLAAGVEVFEYLPMHAYIVSLDRADAGRVAGLEFVRWAGVYQTAWKLDPELGQRPYATADRQALARQGRDRFVVVAFAGANVGEVERAIFAIKGAAILNEEQIGESMELTVEMGAADAGAVALIPGVQYLEPAPEVTPRNSTTRWIIQSNMAGVYPVYAAGIRGEGQVVGIMDGKIDVNHCSFVDAANPIGPSHRKILAYNTSLGADFHGTHVGGTAAGDAGSDTADTRGIAYNAKIVFDDIPSFTETAMNSQLVQHHGQGARAHTNSWGNDGTTAYDGLCRGVDVFSYNNEDSLVLFAVTNQSLLKNPENAKNLLAIGNTGDTPSQGTICTGGAGPTSDGRRKPELWAPGCNTQSASAGSGCGVTGATGTSMASPAAAGAALLVRQYYTNGYYPTGVASGAGFTPTAALIKATMLNSCVDMTGVAGYPTNAEGWGRVLLDNALVFPGDTRKLLVADVRNASGLSTGAFADLNVNVLGSGQQFRVTAVWTEPPATAGASFAAVNDLDLEVIAPNGDLYKGNVFNTAVGASITGGAKDDRNNVEQVHVNSPQVGSWTVRVRGANVAVGTQGYAIVVTGDIVGGTPPPLVINLPMGAPSLIAPGTTTDIAVQVIPGSQSVVPGSPTLWHRATGATSFASSALTPLGGNDYRATLPAFACGNTPQFYFTAMGSGGASASLPGNAPTGFLSASVGTLATTTVTQIDLDTTLPAGWSATGLWHLTASCPPGGTACAGPRAAYYGQDASCTFNTGATNTGTLTSAPIALPAVPPGGSITMTYCSALVTENLSPYDTATVLVNGTQVDQASESASWETRTVSLTQYAGQTITLRFTFDTVDSQFNDFRGWHVDNIRITATGQVCNQPTCYANCDGSTTPPILNVNDFICFQNRFAAGDSYANCDGSSTPPVLNVNDFVCFQNLFAAGCP
ncbi:MAG: S8 family serine peptidase [Phycisphaerae bacterium]|nr:S8 family serine peptidase [Phycisphaerae bacterium]